MGILNKLLGRNEHSHEESLDDSSRPYYDQCQREIKANTPEGWNAEVRTVSNIGGITACCQASTSLDDLLATIPAKINGWHHAPFMGSFGYDMTLGEPWSTSEGPQSGARIMMVWSNDKTSMYVWSHYKHYKEAIDLAQSIIDQARSGYLKVKDALPADLPGSW